jgi:anti-sigma factor RsiW
MMDMDNDIRELTCEQAEDELSGYLDGVLDPPLRRAVEAHLATCDRCQAILADFQRDDKMLRSLPFIEPPPGMRDRFFDSPRMIELNRARSRQRSFVTPLSAALVAAAMLVVALGGALLFRQGVFGSQQANIPGGTTAIGNIGSGVAPLTAGPRLVYARDGALWSVPESGSPTAQQLTSAGMQVAGWNLSPNGRMVIYIDARSGDLHVVRADRLNDTVVGTVTGGKAPLAGFWDTPAGMAIAGGLVWSPDNTRVAYLAQSGTGVALHEMNATGAADVVARAADGSVIGQPLWSADSLYIAYPLTKGGAQSIWVYGVPTSQSLAVASQSDASDAAAVANRITWLPGNAPAITWATSDKGAITGIFRSGVNKSDSAVRLTPAGATYMTADVSTSGGWLLANGSELSMIAAGQKAPQTIATLAHPVTMLRWSPSGETAAIVTGNTLLALMPGHPPVSVASGVAAGGLVAWSPDSAAVAWQSGDAVMGAQIHQGRATGVHSIALQTSALALSWATDGRTLAVRSVAGLLLMSADGAHVRASDSHLASGGLFAWSLAG